MSRNDDEKRKNGRDNYPAFTSRHGNVEAAVWEQRTEDGKAQHRITFSRSYNREGKWERTQSFRRDDLHLVADCIHDAHDWINIRNRQLAREKAQEKSRHAPEVTSRRQPEKQQSDADKKKDLTNDPNNNP